MGTSRRAPGRARAAGASIIGQVGRRWQAGPGAPAETSARATTVSTPNSQDRESAGRRPAWRDRGRRGRVAAASPRRASRTGHDASEERSSMSGFADYEQYDALGLADLVRRRKVTPAELLEAAIERVEARNPTVNAVVLKLYDLARQTIAAGLPDGPFTGVPYLVKDLTAFDRRRAHGARLALLRRHPARHRRQRARGAAQARRPRLLRADEHVRAGPQPHLRAAALRADPEPVGSHAHLRRLQRRRGGRGGRPHPAHGARQRRLRLDPRARPRAAGSSGSSPRAPATPSRPPPARGWAASPPSTR